MTKTLKENYELRLLRNKLQQVDKAVVENTQQTLVLEAFNKEQMAAAIDIVKKLKTLNFGNLTTLAQARDAAVMDVTKSLAGIKDQGIIRKVVSLFKGEAENPLIDALAFADALHNFFSQFTQYIEALSSDDDSQTLSTLVTGKSQEELDKLGSIQNIGPEEKKRLAELQKVIIQGLKPEGTLANVGKNWIDKYLKGKKGLKQLAQDMMKMSVKDLKSISDSVVSGLKNAETIGQAAANASQQASTGTAGSTGSEKTASGEATAGTKGTKSAAKASGQEKGASKAEEVYKEMEDYFDNVVEPDIAKKVIDILIKKGKIK